tara:strand:- start:206 stop:619 length:414 start_codon:yes stop_codon:yes gene_type:complete
MSEIGKNMMIISSPFRNAESFALVPVTSDTPYVEAMFDPASGILAVISKVSKQSFHMVPRLDDNGQPQRLKVPNKTTGKTVKEQRVSMETFSEFYITNKEEIKNFINIFAINADSYDFAKYVDVDIKETKKEPLIIT